MAGNHQAYFWEGVGVSFWLWQVNTPCSSQAKKGFLKTYISLHSTPGRLYAEFDKVDMAESCSLSGSQMCFFPAAQMQCTYVRGIQTNPALTHTCWGEKVKQCISNQTFHAAVVDKVMNKLGLF